MREEGAVVQFYVGPALALHCAALLARYQPTRHFASERPTNKIQED